MCWTRVFGVVKRNLLVFLLFLAATVLMVVKWFVDQDMGGVLGDIAAGLVTGGLVGYFVQRETARVAAEAAARAQELVEARRKHKEEIDELLDRLLAEHEEDLTIAMGSFDTMISVVEANLTLCKNLEDVKQNPKFSLLWKDLDNHYPNLKKLVESLCKEAEQQKKQVKQQIIDYVEQWIQDIASMLNAKAHDLNIKNLLANARQQPNPQQYLSNTIHCQQNKLVQYNNTLLELTTQCTTRELQLFINKANKIVEKLAEREHKLEKAKKELEEKEKQVKQEIIKAKLNKVLPGNCNLTQTKQ